MPTGSDYEQAFAADVSFDVSDVSGSPDEEQWRAAMEAESQSLVTHHTYDVVGEVPKGVVPLRTRWVLKKKLLATGAVDKYKARIVVKGYEQQPGTDYSETFAPVARWTTLRVALAVAMKNQWKAQHLDVRTAFLYGDIDTQLYVTSPSGNDIWLLKKALYGLKQAPRLWNQRLNEVMGEIGYRRSTSDTSLYCNAEGFIVVYVDDMPSFGTPRELARVKNKLGKLFDMTIQPLTWLLGTAVQFSSSAVSLSNTLHIDKILESAGMSNCTPVATPGTPPANVARDEHGTPCAEPALYRRLVGGLNYLVSCTRPDIAAAVSAVAAHMSEPHENHMTAVKRILRYLKGTRDYCLMLRLPRMSDQLQLIGFTDADYAGDPQTRRSQTGYCFMLGNAVISWKSQKQTTVAQSTTEAEYISANEATREAVSLRKLLGEIGVEQQGPSTIYEDNQACISLSAD
eukprot:TRINITY_DN5462_c1_g1_i3.p1 TRINITY_DN5462_c1_g1~~TRINITY_DN5462_c1_g1_i3.p1  ORF type:complete len:457 (-),score=85.43 TRINITY_DN5462_c1_g1_i3:362-1732(-)